MEISTRTLNQAKDQATRMVGRAKIFWQMNTPCTWSALEAHLGIKIDDNFKTGLYIESLSDLTSWAEFYKNSVKTRLELTFSEKTNIFSARKAEVATVKTISEYKTFGNFTLLPEQQAVYEAVVRDFFEVPRTRAALQDGMTGAGKTVFAMAYLHHIIEKGLINQGGPFNGSYITPIFIFCPPTLMELWYRHIEQSGLGKYIGNTIQVIPYSGLSATQGQIYITETQEFNRLTNKEETKLKWNPAMVPHSAIFDECHRLKNDSYQTKAILALLKHNIYSVWMSATPFVTVNDSKAFVLATKARLLDMQVVESNFSYFANLICNEPHKPNLAAAKRLRQLLGPYIYSMPKVKWEHKAINSVLLVDFRYPHERELYNKLYDKYLEKCQLLGKNTDFGRFEQFVALGQFRKGVEPMRMDQIVDRCHQHMQDGDKSPVIGAVFRDSVIRAVFRLIELGYKRSDISVIWGGRPELKVAQVLSEEEFNALFRRTMQGEELTKKDIKRIEATLQFKEEKASYSEQTDEQTKMRLARVSEFGLMGNQTPNQRQLEIDRFQNGDSKICIFTLAAGGVGLSLDHWREGLLPREGFFTPTYSGPEFQQALGRLARRKTLSDTHQHIVGMAGTVEESHVMPLIDKKLRCIAEITNNDYSLIDFHKAKVTELERVRTIEEAIQDSDKDETQLHNIGNSNENDSDDDNNDEAN